MILRPGKKYTLELEVGLLLIFKAQGMLFIVILVLITTANIFFLTMN